MTDGLSVVIPLFDEAENVGPLVAELQGSLRGRPYEIILVDDGSADATLSMIRRAADADPGHVVAVGLGAHQGKQAALLAGFARARHPLVLTMDGDLQDDPAAVDRLLSTKRETGARAVLGARVTRAEGALKRWPSKALNVIVRRRFGVSLQDVNSPLRLVDRELVQELSLRHNEFRFLPVLWAQAGHLVVEVPVRQRPRGRGSSKFRDPWRFVEGLFILATIPPERSAGRLRSSLARLGVSAVLLMAAWKLAEARGLTRLVPSTSWWSLGAIGAANALVLGTKSLRWRTVLGAWGVRMGVAAAFRAYLVGSLMGLLTPWRAGTLIRAGYVMRDTPAPMGTALWSIVVDRALDLLVLAALATPSLGAQGRFGRAAQAGLAVGAVGAALSAVAFLRADPVRGILPSTLSRRSAAPPLWGALGLSAVSYALFFGLAWLLAASMGVRLPPLPFGAALAAVNLVSAVPITLSGVGAREIAMAAFLEPLGVTADRAVAFSLAYFLCFYASAIFFGMLAFAFGPRRGAAEDSPLALRPRR